MTVYTPFTHEQVLSLNAYQHARRFHPFTCVDDEHEGILVASTDGWHCPECTYVQEWAYEWMADESWRAPWMPTTDRRVTR